MKKLIAAIMTPLAVLAVGILIAAYLLHDPNKVKPERKPGFLTRTWRQFYAIPFGYQFVLILCATAAPSALLF